MTENRCDSCGSEYKYKCPACSRLSCSLNCVKTHKANTGCTGQVDVTAYLPKKDLLTTLALDRDYNFLQRIGRDIIVDKSDARAHKVFKPRDQWRAGVRVHSVAKGMSRSRKNRSKWNNPEKQFEWTVEIRKPEGITYEQVGDKLLVSQLIDQYGGPSLTVAALIDSFGTRHVLDKSLTLQDAIRGKNVLEFPTIALAEEVVSSSGSDSSEESDSDSSEDESDDSSDDEKPETGDEKTVVEAQAEGVPAEGVHIEEAPAKEDSDSGPDEESTKFVDPS